MKAEKVKAEERKKAIEAKKLEAKKEVSPTTRRWSRCIGQHAHRRSAGAEFGDVKISVLTIHESSLSVIAEQKEQAKMIRKQLKATGRLDDMKDAEKKCVYSSVARSEVDADAGWLTGSRNFARTCSFSSLKPRVW